MPKEDGLSEREHLLEVERQTGQTPLPLIGPEFPEEMLHVWSAFLSLSGTRSAGFSGPLPITYSEIRSWMEVTGNYLSPWEVDAVKKLDAVYLRVVNKHGRH
jgi:hypothetical protein